MKDSLGDRMKESYENRTRYILPRRTYTIMRIDGKAFHTYTRGLLKPFDDGLIKDMNETAIYLCQNIMGVKFAYVQSDEISLLLTDFGDIGTEAWFDGNLQKMASVGASMATARFNRLRYVRLVDNPAFDGIYNLENTSFCLTDPKFKDAEFDARVFQIPQKAEVANYFIWRQQDATRNSISSVAQSMYSHKELKGVNSNQQQELIFQKGVNWNDFPSGLKRGRFIERNVFVNNSNIGRPQVFEIGEFDVVRNRWVVVECPIFTEDKEYLYDRIPDNI